MVETRYALKSAGEFVLQIANATQLCENLWLSSLAANDLFGTERQDGKSMQERRPMKSPTILWATWSDGLFAFGDDGHSHEIPNVSVRGLAPDGNGGALAIVGSHSLSRYTSDGKLTALAMSEFELSCCVAAGAVVYVGTDDARMLRLSDGSDFLEPIDASITSRGAMPGLPARPLSMGNVLGRRWVFGRSRPIPPGAFSSPMFTSAVLRVPPTAEEAGTRPSTSTVTSTRCAQPMQIPRSS
jgi:hypothetical protein